MNRTLAALFAAGLAAFALSACDDEGRAPPEPPPTPDPCDGVTCDDELACDPADGLCKCGGEGGLVCQAGERCEPEPTPTCVSTLCELQACTGGQSCDPADGLCKCGGAGGVACADGQSCNVAQRVCEPGLCADVTCARGQSCDVLDGACKCGAAPCGAGEACEAGACVAADLCAGVTCGGGESCDAADGICKCGGAACSFGQRCEAGGCVIDRCAGVNCGPGSVCAPQDGLCHCGTAGGQVCTAGQSCVDRGAGALCEGSSLCADAADRCRGGTTCDPADGQCRCGGVGATAPICGANQTCDLDTGTCLGGNRCQGVSCAEFPGTSCDPEDGLCKCGGLGGLLCVQGQVCVQDQGEPLCLDTCNPIGNPSGCVGDTACYYDASETLSFCTAPGSGQRDDGCSSPISCGPGLHCTLQAADPTCRPYCAVPAAGGLDTCAGDDICLQLDGAPAGLGTCRTVN